MAGTLALVIDGHVWGLYSLSDVILYITTIKGDTIQSSRQRSKTTLTTIELSYTINVSNNDLIGC